MVLGLVLLNTGALPIGVSSILRLLGVSAFVAELVMLRRRRSSGDVAPPQEGRRFGRCYWLGVAVEVVAVAIGMALLNEALHAAKAGVAWMSFVVAVHFLGLDAVSRAGIRVDPFRYRARMALDASPRENRDRATPAVFFAYSAKPV